MWVDKAYMNSMGYLYNIICSTDCTFAFIYKKSPISENSPGQPTWRTCRCAPFFFCISLLRINLKSVGTVRHFTLVMDRIYLTRFLCLVFPILLWITNMYRRYTMAMNAEKGMIRMLHWFDLYRLHIHERGLDETSDVSTLPTKLKKPLTQGAGIKTSRWSAICSSVKYIFTKKARIFTGFYQGWYSKKIPTNKNNLRLLHPGIETHPGFLCTVWCRIFFWQKTVHQSQINRRFMENIWWTNWDAVHRFFF